MGKPSTKLWIHNHSIFIADHVCVICGRDTDNKHICSQECYQQWRYLYQTRQTHKLDGVRSPSQVGAAFAQISRKLLTCQSCGKRFVGTAKRLYCSEECAAVPVYREYLNRLKIQRHMKSLKSEDTMSSEIYTCKPTPHPNTYAMVKFTNELDPRSTYIVSESECNCPRGELGKPCRHRDMLRTFHRSKHIGDGWFFNYSTKQWIKPVEDFEPAQEKPQPVAVAPELEVPSLPPTLVVNGSGASLRRRPWNG
jgi:hypothetical protein